MNFLFLIATAFSLAMPKPNHSELAVGAQQMLTEATYDVALEKVGKSKKYVLKEPDFQCTFPGEPTKSSKDVPTDIGSIEMTSFMYEQNSSYVMMVAVSDYPEAFIAESNSTDLLTGGRDGAIESLGIEAMSSETWGEVDGHKSLEFTADNDYYFLHYKMILRGNRLYQVAILRDDQAPDPKDVKKFIGSFKFK